MSVVQITLSDEDAQKLTLDPILPLASAIAANADEAAEAEKKECAIKSNRLYEQLINEAGKNPNRVVEDLAQKKEFKDLFAQPDYELPNFPNFSPSRGNLIQEAVTRLRAFLPSIFSAPQKQIMEDDKSQPDSGLRVAIRYYADTQESQCNKDISR